MKTMQAALRALIFLALFPIASCTKDLKEPGEAVNLQTSSDASINLSKCKIRKLFAQYPGDPNPPQLVAIFSYNSAGNPYSVLHPSDESAPSAFYFKYDANKRLTEYIEMAGSVEYNHHYYKHNASGQIIRDSIILFDEGKAFYTDISTIEYDSQGRVIKETIVNTRNDFGTLNRIRRPTYTYDARGNLAVKGHKSSSYDYKVNPLRQSPVLQFIHRNYSMNNASVQLRYNSKGLPLSMRLNNDDFFGAWDYAKVEYDCL